MREIQVLSRQKKLTNNIVSYCPIFCIFCDFWCIFTICCGLWFCSPLSTIRHNMQACNPIYRLVSDLTTACGFVAHNIWFWALFLGSKIGIGPPEPIIVCNSEVFFIFVLFRMPILHLLISVYLSWSTAWTLCFLR